GKRFRATKSSTARFSPVERSSCSTKRCTGRCPTRPTWSAGASTCATATPPSPPAARRSPASSPAAERTRSRSPAATRTGWRSFPLPDSTIDEAKGPASAMARRPAPSLPSIAGLSGAAELGVEAGDLLDVVLRFAVGRNPPVLLHGAGARVVAGQGKLDLLHRHLSTVLLRHLFNVAAEQA